MLHKADGGGGGGGGGCQIFWKKSVTKVECSMLLALRGGGWGSNFQKNSVKAKIYSIFIYTHQLHCTPLHHFTI